MLHFALQKLHLLPHQVLELPDSELAFVYASIAVRAENEKKRMKELESKTDGR